MFLKRQRRRVGDVTYEYWALVRTVRTARGPRHQFVACLGKLDGDAVQRGRDWGELDALLEGRERPVQLELGGARTAAATPPAASAPWTGVDVRGVRVERLRQFGRVYLGLALWRRLGLHKILAELLPGRRVRRKGVTSGIGTNAVMP